MKNKLLSLQLIRGFAAVMVAVNHIWNDPNAWVPGAIVDYGAFGVDLFFVLSGFIMCLTVRLDADSKVHTALNFLKRRIYRIFPVYLICAIPLILFVTHAEGKKDTIFYLGNLLLLPSYGTAQFRLALPVGWTLVYEMLFYYTFTVLLFFIKNKKTLVYSLFSIIIGTYLLTNILELKEPRLAWINLMYILGDTQLLNFAAGILVYLIYDWLKDQIAIKISNSILLFILISFIIIVIIWQKIPHAWFSLLGDFLIILVATLTPIKNANNSILIKLLFVGDASYSIYLTHFYWAFFKPKILALLGLFIANQIILINVTGIFCVVGAVITGCIFYMLIEKPIINFFTNKKRISIKK